MAGIFPAVGSTPNNTQNAVNPSVVPGCTPLFYPNNCNPRFGPLAFDTLEKFWRGEPIPPKIILTDRLFDASNAAQFVAEAY